MKAAKAKYFAEIVTANRHNPRVLFNMVNTALNVPQSDGLEASPEVCENFL